MLSRIFRDDVENRQANRRRQIDTLKIFNDNVTEIKEDEEYKIDFIAGEIPMCLYITLPPEFPVEKPKIRIQPPITHSWVNNNCDIDNAPGLLNFTVHSDLGRVVQVIIREFEIRPPVVLGQNPNVSPDKTPGWTSVPLHQYPFPDLVSLTKEDLQLLNDNPDKLEDFVCSLKQSQDYNSIIEARINDVEALAKDNLSKQGKLEKLRRKVINRIEQAIKLKSSFDEKSKEYEKLCQQFNPQNIKDALRLAAAQSDEESEVIADKFLNRDMDVEQFLVEYIEKRKLSQLRKTKEEKLSNQLKELQKMGF